MKKLFENNKSKKGFTLIEVLVATAILSISLVVLFHTFSKSIQAIRVSQDYITGKWLLERKIHEIEIGEIAQETSEDYQMFTEPFTKFSWKIEVSEKMDLNKVKYTVKLPNRSNNRKIQVVSYLTD